MSDLQFQPRQSYSFKPWSLAIPMLGDNYMGCTVLGVIDRQTAEMFTDITAQHQALMAFLPAGSSTNPDDYSYLRVQLASGVTTIVSVGWIDPTTVVPLLNTNANVTILQVAAADLPRIRNALISNGFQVGDMSIVNQ